MEENKVYDFVIIGSGIGGLECAFILASEGHSVVVLEKNHQIGGNLQVFSRNKAIFDTGVHYIGSLDEGQCLDQFFKYFGLRDSLKWKRLDQDCFDLIIFPDGKSYKLGQGYEQFKKNLKEYFPEEGPAIDKYCETIQSICLQFPMYNLDAVNVENHILDPSILEINAADFLDSLSDNHRFKAVLAGNNALYAGQANKTPLYVHALITNSYILGSYRLRDGGSQLAIHLMRSIRAFGGEILRNKKVVGANYAEDGLIREVILSNGEVVKGKNFISNMHPEVTIDVFGENRFLKAYSKRIKKLENTPSSFIVHIALKENTFKYLNYNIYKHFNDDVWGGINYTSDNWADNLFICTPSTKKSEEFADSMAVMAYMHHDEVKQWEQTANTVAEPENRGEEYSQFKKQKEEIIIGKLEQLYPDIRSKIKAVYSTSPLTYRDYIGDKEGSLYGIMKDCNKPIHSIINPSTRIPNLYLTGQNLIFHGILGATIGAFVTCFHFVDKATLMAKVKAID